jgi:hypothetical protein
MAAPHTAHRRTSCTCPTMCIGYVAPSPALRQHRLFPLQKKNVHAGVVAHGGDTIQLWRVREGVEGSQTVTARTLHRRQRCVQAVVFMSVVSSSSPGSRRWAARLVVPLKLMGSSWEAIGLQAAALPRSSTWVSPELCCAAADHFQFRKVKLHDVAAVIAKGLSACLDIGRSPRSRRGTA